MKSDLKKYFKANMSKKEDGVKNLIEEKSERVGYGKQTKKEIMKKMNEDRLNESDVNSNRVS